MNEPNRKSRRRFLADMLFLGGGLSAAALLSGSDLGCSTREETPPPTAGAVMLAPSPPSPAASPTPPPQAAGELIAPPPRSRGVVTIPKSKRSCD